jgi:hypothetical protein
MIVGDAGEHPAQGLRVLAGVLRYVHIAWQGCGACCGVVYGVNLVHVMQTIRYKESRAMSSLM